MVKCPHGPDEHGPRVPAFGNHTSDDQGNNTGQERCPVTDVAVIAIFGGDAELVGYTDASKVVKRPGECQNPHSKSDHKRHVGSVEALALSEEGKPSLFTGWRERSSGQHTCEQTRNGEHGPVGKEHVSSRLSLQVHGRYKLSAALHGVG